MQAVRRRCPFHLLVSVVAVVWCADAAADATIRIDYSTDESGFFGSGNPDGASAGAQAKAAMDAAAAFYTGILDDTLSAITPPTKFYGSLGGEATWYWKRKFPNPATGQTNTMLNQSFAANDYVVFVGARELGEDPAEHTLGRGGAGGWTNTFSRNGQFTSDETAQLDEMNEDFKDAVSMRGQASGFGSWGGSVAFDINTNWHFNHTTNPAGGTIDFYSVALHELAHALGFGASETWDDLVSDSTFTGSNAVASYGQGNSVPLASATDLAHWDSVISSTVYDDGVSQTPVMVPELPAATRRQLTNLDAAALVDLGWEIDLPEPAAASFTGSAGFSETFVAAPLMATVVPEPASGALMLCGLLALGCASRLNRKRDG